jgi:hypothetical protein
MRGSDWSFFCLGGECLWKKYTMYLSYYY